MLEVWLLWSARYSCLVQFPLEHPFLQSIASSVGLADVRLPTERSVFSCGKYMNHKLRLKDVCLVTLVQVFSFTAWISFQVRYSNLSTLCLALLWTSCLPCILAMHVLVVGFRLCLHVVVEWFHVEYAGKCQSEVCCWISGELCQVR